MNKSNDTEPAVNLIRQKLAAIYGEEPNVKQEIQTVQNNSHRSKHQKFMYDLSQSGRSLSEIQTAWHAYYAGLPDKEKHEVWNEFYRQYETQRQQKPTPTSTQPLPKPPSHPQLSKQKTKTYHDLKKQLIEKVQTRSNLTKQKNKQNLKSIGFGLAMGFITLIFFLFGFFNERFIAPFVTPSRQVSSAPIIIDSDGGAVGKEPLLFIPKINLQVPVVYDEESVDEDAVQKALESGVLHYATTPDPGQKGNGVIFGHSSNNIFNNGKYKFAFVLLKQLEKGDTFTVQKDGKRYVYKIFDKKVVSPSDLSVLDSISGKEATMTLITCDPPGTSINRLVVVGEQISPDPAGNKQSTAIEAETPTVLPSNAPSLWSRLTSWLSN
jgi:sortase A